MTKYLHMENDTQAENRKGKILHCSLPKTGLESITGPWLTRAPCPLWGLVQQNFAPTWVVPLVRRAMVVQCDPTAICWFWSIKTSGAHLSRNPSSFSSLPLFLCAAPGKSKTTSMAKRTSPSCQRLKDWGEGSDSSPLGGAHAHRWLDALPSSRFTVEPISAHDPTRSWACIDGSSSPSHAATPTSIFFLHSSDDPRPTAMMPYSNGTLKRGGPERMTTVAQLLPTWRLDPSIASGGGHRENMTMWVSKPYLFSIQPNRLLLATPARCTS
jgi:hypothetical protein